MQLWPRRILPFSLANWNLQFRWRPRQRVPCSTGLIISHFYAQRGKISEKKGKKKANAEANKTDFKRAVQLLTTLECSKSVSASPEMHNFAIAARSSFNCFRRDGNAGKKSLYTCYVHTYEDLSTWLLRFFVNCILLIVLFFVNWILLRHNTMASQWYWKISIIISHFISSFFFVSYCFRHIRNCILSLSLK